MVAQNFTEAADWFERAAKQGLVPAQFRLGGLYEKGLGVKKDLEIARRLYLAAAQAGNAKAMHNLAVLYAEGIDGKPDYRARPRAGSARPPTTASPTASTISASFMPAASAWRRTSRNPTSGSRWPRREGDQDAAKQARRASAARLDAQSLTAARLAVQTWTAEPQPEAATEVKAPAGGWDGALAPSQAKRRVGSEDRTVGRASLSDVLHKKNAAGRALCGEHR